MVSLCIQAGLKLVAVFLPQSPECWYCRCAPPCLASFLLFNNCFFLFPTDYVPYVNAVDSRWSSYGNEATPSAHYIDR